MARQWDASWAVDMREVEQKILKAANLFNRDRVEDITKGGAELVRDEVKRRIPVGPTENLKDAAIVKRLDRRMGRPGPWLAAIDRKKAPHAWLVEYGGRNVRKPKKAQVLANKGAGEFFGTEVAPMPKSPYFRPAVEAKRGEVARHLENGLRRLVEGFR